MKKRHEQVEKTLEMKNGVGMALQKNKVGMCMMLSQCNTGLFLTIQYQGECGHIEGHAYSVVFSRVPEALRGLMTKHLSCIHNTVVLLLHSSSIHLNL